MNEDQDSETVLPLDFESRALAGSAPTSSGSIVLPTRGLMNCN